MALKYLTDIDLNKNELQNAVIQILPTDPQNLSTKTNNSVGDSGLIWFNSSDGFLKYFNGTQTIPIGRMNFEASTANIKMNGTVSVGSLNTVARADHIHPSDTSRVPTTRTINGHALSSNVAVTRPDVGIFYGQSDTVAGDKDKIVSLIDSQTTFTNNNLVAGTRIIVAFQGGNSIPQNPMNPMTLSIDGCTTKPVLLNGNYVFLEEMEAGTCLEFLYNGTSWQLIGYPDHDTQSSYATGTSVEIEAGASTASKLWTPKVLHDYIVSTAGASADAMRFKGTIGTGGTITTLPTTDVSIGDTYRVITAGTYAGQTCEVGDLIIAIATTPTWTVAQTNIDGAITSITGTSPVSVTGSGASRTISVSNATTSSAGLMSAYDKDLINKFEDFYYDFLMFEVTSPLLTPDQNTGICTWSIPLKSSSLTTAEIKETSTGVKVVADIIYNNTNDSVQIKMISSSSIPAGTYTAVICTFANGA